MTDLPALLKRTLAAEGADREIDAAVHAALTDWRRRYSVAHDLKFVEATPASPPGFVNVRVGAFETGGVNYSDKAPHYTASVDAVIALADKMLPDLLLMLRRVHPDLRTKHFPKAWHVSAQLYCSQSGWGEGFSASAPTPALALLAALLRAMIAEGK